MATKKHSLYPTRRNRSVVAFLFRARRKPSHYYKSSPSQLLVCRPEDRGSRPSDRRDDDNNDDDGYSYGGWIRMVVWYVRTFYALSAPLVLRLLHINARPCVFLVPSPSGSRGRHKVAPFSGGSCRFCHITNQNFICKFCLITQEKGLILHYWLHLKKKFLLGDLAKAKAQSLSRQPTVHTSRSTPHPRAPNLFASFPADPFAISPNKNFISNWSCDAK
jgi:hypothetical protein